MRPTGLLLAFLAACASVVVTTQLGAQLFGYDWSYNFFIAQSDEEGGDTGNNGGTGGASSSSSSALNCGWHGGFLGIGQTCGGDCGSILLECKTTNGVCACTTRTSSISSSSSSSSSAQPCGWHGGFLGIGQTCGGVCSNGGTCETDSQGSNCGCVPPPPPCGDNNVGECGGTCSAPNTICKVRNNVCGCYADVPECGPTGSNGQCGGICYDQQADLYGNCVPSNANPSGCTCEYTI